METITKISKNNVEVSIEKTETTTETETYGQRRIDAELIDAQKQLTDAQNLDADAYKNNLIAKAQERIDRLNLIQTEMNRNI